MGIITSSLKNVDPVRMVIASLMSFSALFNAFRFISRSVKPMVNNVSRLSSRVAISVEVDEDTIEQEMFSIDEAELLDRGQR